MNLSNSQIDKIGDKLRKGEMDADCLRKLEFFRGLYAGTYKYVEDVLENKIGVPVTGRPSKSTVAIVEKLKRETIRLCQFQDIAGCRVLVEGLAEQDRLVDSLQILFPLVDIDDKRQEPTNGYRAVHVIVWKEGLPVEVQVRTKLQHAWAEISEKVADDHGHEIKYGKGDESARSFLAELSALTDALERARHNHRFLVSQRRSTPKDRSLARLIKSANTVERETLRKIRRLFKPG